MEVQRLIPCFLLILFSHANHGKLIIKSPPYSLRIYPTAPEGVHVTTVQAFDPEFPSRTVTYSLLDVGNRAQFAIDSRTGNLTTAATIHQNIGFVFHVLVAALSQGSTELRKMEIVVSEYNRQEPVFQQNLYRADMHILAQVGTRVLTVDATDDDVIPYNAQISYHLDRNASNRYFDVDMKSGHLQLVHPLSTPITSLVQSLHEVDSVDSTNLIFSVYVQDGGSPVRRAYAEIRISVKNISEPRSVRSVNPTDTTVDVCWTRPVYGEPLGYLIKYRELVSGGVVEVTSNSYLLNVTTNDYSKCTTIIGLRPWTDYQFRVYAWNLQEIGMPSELGTMETKANYCSKNVCKKGTCQPLNVEPGYWCECPKGYYGPTCELFDACSLSPCQNLGVCRNTSHNQYQCNCLLAFSGTNCSHFNPCAVQPSPCLNGGQCTNTASHKYECTCAEGYHGKTCQNYNPCVSNPCVNGAQCHNLNNSNYACTCPSGYSGLNCEWNVNECRSNPCANGATCLDEVNGFRCVCPSGYHAHDCSRPVQCSREVTRSEKGVMVWEPTDHGNVARSNCPFGYRPWQGSNTARRRCRLLPSGEVAWAKVQDHHCREEAYYLAEILTEELVQMTEDPSNLTAGQIRKAVTKLMEIVDLSAKDPKIAQNMFNVISNLMSVNGSLLEEDDISEMILMLVDGFTSEVQLEPSHPVEIQTENLALKVVAMETKNGLPRMEDNHVELSQALNFKNREPVAERRVSYTEKNNDGFGKSETRKLEKSGHITIPVEALERLSSQEKNVKATVTTDVRLKFVFYRNAKLFPSQDRAVEDRDRASYQCKDPRTGVYYSSKEAGVLQASVHTLSAENLSHPVVYVMPAPACLKPRCVYWDPEERAWSTEGVWTNTSGDRTVCYSSHLTAFSVLFDLNDDVFPDDRKLPLPLISYLGSALSILALLFTIITYSLFRCLNRDRSGKILLNLCASLLLLNLSFLAGSQRGWTIFDGLDICVLVAVLLHYFLLTTLTWMGMEALNMYQLLIHIFAFSESRFMFKRCLIGWGLPLIVVGVTLSVQGEEYFRENNYCMLSNSNPYVYYLSFLGPSSLILLLNLSLFVLVARVLFLPRNATVTVTTVRKNSITGNSSAQQVVSLAQVRVAFTVMILLSVSWIFGDLTVGELNLFFEYVFGICNFLQGLFIFVARCLCVPDARVAWSQLIQTGTLKKYRGVVPPGTTSFYANSGNVPNNQSTIPKSTSQRSERQGPNADNRIYNSNFWTSNSRLSQAMRNSFAEADLGWNRSCLTFAPLGSSVQSILSETKVSNLDRMSAMNLVEDDDQSEFGRYSRPLTLQLQQEHDTSSQSSACTRSSNLSDESPNCTFCGRPGCKALEDGQCFITELSYITV